MIEINRTGGVIGAASKKDAMPLFQVGTIPIIKRIVITFQQVGIFPIVIITGTQEEEVKYQLSGYGVIFLKLEDCEQPKLFESVKIGLHYLEGKCGRVMFTPVNAPMYTADTLASMLSMEGEIITPRHEGIPGHPILLSQSVFPRILAYRGEEGLRGAMESLTDRRVFADVPDPGILCTIHDSRELERRLSEHNRALLHPFVQLGLQKEHTFFNTRVKLLLYLIHDTHSVRGACAQMALSYSKAWDMLNKLEQETGFSVVDRRHGGSRGGKTCLTPKGLEFLRTWLAFEDHMFQHAQKEFTCLFRDSGLLS